ncbi:mismatch-specific DNA-glycosylase [Rothia sp. ZJ932]|uniref:mismatch-specific DNA-glycosylase n=1 Tax=Rothia sp. ZJ932 TaxID=2810516 RepID=UPI001967A64C|nr:mismatch-specific DNA-glycosylase [Rothia sp. ZJ932]QRZ60876.1 mismatch-specific DNA-glycosylase [Rothia sp. ZJ932]
MSIRYPSSLGDRRPSREELQNFANATIDDRLPPPGTPLRLLIVGINPGLWTAAVNAPFAYPGNRFWPSLDRAGIISPRVDASRGLSDEVETQMERLGIGITNMVARATARADELTKEELQASVPRLIELTHIYQPQALAIAGITAYRTAFNRRKATLGEQDASFIEGWNPATSLWVVPQPSGLNAHENIDSLADKWQQVWLSTSP